MGGDADVRVGFHSPPHCRTCQRCKHQADDSKGGKQPRYGKTELHLTGDSTLPASVKEARRSKIFLLSAIEDNHAPARRNVYIPWTT